MEFILHQLHPATFRCSSTISRRVSSDPTTAALLVTQILGRSDYLGALKPPNTQIPTSYASAIASAVLARISLLVFNYLRRASSDRQPSVLVVERMFASKVSCMRPMLAVIIMIIFAAVNAVDGDVSTPKRGDFPLNFVFGVASSAYQYEGAYQEDGKGPSNWDLYTHIPGNIVDGTNGDVADDQYHRYEEDVKLMSEIGVQSYRFSIAWSRIFPEGRGEINRAGLKYYNDLIDSLLSRGIQPFVTLYHYDLPQALEDLYGGWLHPNIVKDFSHYAETCFRHFGDRVKYWTTLNEPNFATPLSYDSGIFPPNRCCAPFGNCRDGNSSTEPYIAAHNMLLAHASAVDIYRTKYQVRQEGVIGIVVQAIWYEPLRNVSEDLEAVERRLTFENAWFLDPIVWGEYPAIMRRLVGLRLPSITKEMQNKLRGSYDFIGLNYYSALYATDASHLLTSPRRDYGQDSLTESTGKRDGVPIGLKMAIPKTYGVPYGLRKTVNYLKTRYANPPIFITENGFGDKRDDTQPLEEILNDTVRVDYIRGSLSYLREAMREGADVRGYFLWSLLDNFEWKCGHTVMFGICHVDFQGWKGRGLRRYPKLSARWYQNFLNTTETLGKKFSIRYMTRTRVRHTWQSYFDFKMVF